MTEIAFLIDKQYYLYLFYFQKLNNVSFWAHNLYSHDSKMMDLKLDSLKQDLKPNNKHFSYNQEKMDIEHSELINKPKKNVTFFMSSEDKVSDESNDISNTCKNIDTNFVDSNISKNNMSTNSIFIKKNPKLKINTNQLSKNVTFDLMKTNVDSENLKNECDLNIQSNKRKQIKVIDQIEPDFEFKKPCNPVQVEVPTNIDTINSNTVNPAINKEVFISKLNYI